jgi:hypothetical protein
MTAASNDALWLFDILGAQWRRFRIRSDFSLSQEAIDRIGKRFLLHDSRPAVQ